MKKKHEEHENHERWLVSYADFITLLFAFFVVMYAVSSVNEGKYKTLSESLVSAFTNHKPIGHLSLIELPFEKHVKEVVEEPPKVTDPIRAYLKIANVIETMPTPEGVVVKTTARGLNIRIKEDALFASGSTHIQPAVKEFLDLVAGLVKDLPNHISVEGHTDARPIHTPTYPSNWELAASRATTLVRYFTDVHGLDPQRFSATSFAGYRPVAPNETSEGRAANRRVEIVVLRNTTIPEPSRNPLLG
ncbi:MAG: flagellar motor protein MotD [Nitrospirae bacterium]|nr:MAG: flagellar motor protein MotD [Nitrospirota bacterium]